MKSKKLFSIFFLMLLLSLRSFALDYTITFTGTGASTAVDSVIVLNLTKSTTVTVPTGNSLKLSDVPNALEYANTDNENICVYSNIEGGISTVSFFAKQTGISRITVFSIDGRQIVGSTENLQIGINSFQLSLPKGAFSIQVSGKGYTYTTKIISQTGTVRKPEITFLGINKPSTNYAQKSKSSSMGTTTMLYASGDRLLYKGISGNNCTVVTDVPTASKTTNFNFVECKDADGNYYSVVKIGNQTWMAENLKTTKYRNGDAIGTTTPAAKDISGETTPKYQWAYNGDETNLAKYGRLYTWYAATDTRNLTPVGWHVPTDAEWTTLENYLIANGYNYDGTTTGNKIAKSFAANTVWNTYTGIGTIGNDLTKNNSSGFTALPGGYRYYTGQFVNLGKYGYWWSSTEFNITDAWYRYLNYSNFYLYRIDYYKNHGYSVRCILD